MKPKTLIAGNWKMNKTPSETRGFLQSLKKAIVTANCEVAVLVPAVSLQTAAEALAGSAIQVGAQNCYFEEKGAYTGEISPQMLKDLDVTYVVLGHSERRSLFNETDELINKKIKAVLQQGMKPIFCVGETLVEREAGREKDVVEKQVKAGLQGVDSLQNMVVAYEPVWAIGTGKTATTEQAQEMCKFIRNCLRGLYEEEGQGVTIQYGGSMSSKNAKELLQCEDINGGLIGSASLKIEDFTAIIAAYE